MLLELTEALRCPKPHDESYIICAPMATDGRDVVRGGLLCPECSTEYAIIDRIAWLAPPSASAPPVPHSELTADAVMAFLDLQGHGGFVVLAGNAARLGGELASKLAGINVVALNPPADVTPSADLTVVHSPHAWPFRRSALRAVVLGSDALGAPWPEAAVGSLLSGLRLIAENEAAAYPGLVDLARGAGVFVGEKRAR